MALFFGLSGTGKTTLSADPNRRLIGDDEHGWSDEGIFNFEGGCYAKVIRLSAENEPEIYATTRRFGTVLENVVQDRTSRKLDLDDDRFTENTRAGYPLEFIPNVVPEGMVDSHPKNVVLLTCDAQGVLPPIARLDPEHAVYHFMSGYTSKIAGTEIGLGIEPEIAFSACFGAPFMVHHPFVYADMLRKKMLKHGATCWLVNTGWVGGGWNVGKRISIRHTRNLLNAALDGKLDEVEFRKDKLFGFEVPLSCPDVPDRCPRPVDIVGQQGRVLEALRRTRGALHRELQALHRRLSRGGRRRGSEAVEVGKRGIRNTGESRVTARGSPRTSLQTAEAPSDPETRRVPEHGDDSKRSSVGLSVVLRELPVLQNPVGDTVGRV